MMVSACSRGSSRDDDVGDTTWISLVSVETRYCTESVKGKTYPFVSKRHFDARKGLRFLECFHLELVLVPDRNKPLAAKLQFWLVHSEGSENRFVGIH